MFLLETVYFLTLIKVSILIRKYNASRSGLIAIADRRAKYVFLRTFLGAGSGGKH